MTYRDFSDSIGGVFRLAGAPGRARWRRPGSVGTGGVRRRTAWVYLGPATMAATAYMDPGNVAVNIEAGARHGYRLLWVVLAANLVAMLFQALSAKLGIATGRNLAELSRDTFPRPAVWGMWALAEIAAMATDLAEFIGGAVGVVLLLHISLLTAMALIGAATFAILLLEGAGFRPLEVLIAVFVSVIGACYLIEILVAPVSWGEVAAGLLPQAPQDHSAWTLAVGIIGATVMPHALYLHSGLTQARAPLYGPRQRRGAARVSNIAVIAALTVAGAINLAMIITAGSALRGNAAAGIESAYGTLGSLLGPVAAASFLAALIASGLSSSVVGTMAGQMVMQGFVRFRLPVWLRRVATMLPAFAVVALGVPSTVALVLSQVVLSLALPAPMIALVLLTRRRDIMGDCVNSRPTTAGAVCAAVLVSGFNLVLVAQSL